MIHEIVGKDTNIHKHGGGNNMYISPNGFTCEGFLLLLKGCMLGPDDFEFVSRPGRMISPLSPTCLPLVSH